jgi:autoinducer 2-degrading protein
MFIVTVRIQVKPDAVDDFIAATLENAKNTRREPGNLRFDVLRANDDPAKFFFYEVYRAEADHKSHQTTAHYLAWRERVAPHMAVPRVGEKFTNLFPDPWD